jgi:hypothetical protein
MPNFKRAIFLANLIAKKAIIQKVRFVYWFIGGKNTPLSLS